MTIIRWTVHQPSTGSGKLKNSLNYKKIISSHVLGCVSDGGNRTIMFALIRLDYMVDNSVVY